MWSGFWPKAPSSPLAEQHQCGNKICRYPSPGEYSDGARSEGLGPDIAAGVRRIKAQAGPDLVLWGSSTLTSTLLQHGLADEMVLMVSAVMLGQGQSASLRRKPGAQSLSLSARRQRQRHSPQSLQGCGAIEALSVNPPGYANWLKGKCYSALVWNRVGGGRHRHLLDLAQLALGNKVAKAHTQCMGDFQAYQQGGHAFGASNLADGGAGNACLDGKLVMGQTLLEPELF